MEPSSPIPERTVRPVALFLAALFVGFSVMLLFTVQSGPATGPSTEQARTAVVHPAADQRLYCDWFNGSSPPRLRPDMVCRYNLYPGYSNVTYVETNEDGFRYGSLEGGEGTRRIAVLGDGVAFGLGVPAGDAFPALLDARLLNATVVNAAAPWYGIADSYRTAERLENTTDIDLFLLPLEPEDTVDAAAYQTFIREAGERFPSAWMGNRRRIADVRVQQRLEEVPSRIADNSSVLQEYLGRFRGLERRTGARVVVFSVQDSRYIPGLVRGAGLQYIGQPAVLEGDYMDHRLAPEEPFLDQEGHRVVARFLEARVGGVLGLIS